MADDSNDDRTKSFVALTVGTTVSHHKIISKLGPGGMGDVYLAEDTELDREVALKFLSPHLCQDKECRKRFKREAQAAAKSADLESIRQAINDTGAILIGVMERLAIPQSRSSIPTQPVQWYQRSLWPCSMDISEANAPHVR